MFLRQEEGVATLTLNNHEKLNAMSNEMWNDFQKIIDHIQGNNNIGIVDHPSQKKRCSDR